MKAEYLDGIALPTPEGPTVAKVDEFKIGDDRTTAVYADRAGGRPLAIDWLGAPNAAEDFRIGQADVAASPVDPLTTAVVLGKQYEDVEWVDLFYPPTMPMEGANRGLARNRNFQYPMWGTAHLEEFDTALVEGAPYGVSGLDVLWLASKLNTFGWASLVTLEESARAESLLNWVTRKAGLPMTIVNRAMQFQAYRQLIDTTAEVTYATGHVLNKGAGAEWDQPGVDMQADALAAVTTIGSKASVTERAITCVMTHQSYRAALQNEGYKAFHSGVLVPQNNNVMINETRLAQFLGVREVIVINPTGPGGRPLFGDLAWFLVRDPSLEEYGDDYGSERFAARFGVNDGVVLESFSEHMIRSTLFPVIKEYVLQVLNPGAAYLITNTSSSVL